MVLKKKSECQFSGGFQVPTIPRGPRSSRRRVPNEKKVDDNSQICAFELLASLAGKLLQESESSASSNASEGNNIPVFGTEARELEIRVGDKLLKEECFEHGSSEESAFAPEFSSEDIDEKKFIQKKLTDASSEHTPSKSDFVHKADDDNIKPVICKTKSAFPNYPSKVDGDNVDNGRTKGNRLEKADLTMADTFDSSGPMELQVEFSSMVKLDNDVKLSLREAGPNGSFSRHRNNIKLVGRDDDEKFSRYINKLGTKGKAFRPQTHVGDHRIRKFLTSKYWKVAPKLRDSEVYRSDGGKKTPYNKRKHYYYHDRGHYETMNKRKRLYGRSSGVSSDGGFSSESVTNSPEKAKKGDTSGSNGMFHGATGVSPSVICRQSSFHSNDSHVKLSIKSFKIPEVYIELPETATVGSLKRTVMEAITAIIGAGLQVGVLLEGEKIRDDNITLLQTGISCKDNLDNLGFTLEPNTKKLPSSMSSDEPRASLPCDTTGPLISSPGTPFLDSVISEASPELPHSATTVENVHDAVSSQSDSLANKTTADSRALVVLPPISVEALAVVPATPKSRKSSELVQRRTRRPFSVTEVEALVHAVEELGTGRWRDVKLRAFEDADHRTYVDLKDKWKTLVHTATISPQQRRGEPVPQELLDRVLGAHSYWSEHQAKQHGKPQNGATQVGGGHSVEGNSITVM